MTGMKSPKKFILELAGSASPDLNMALNEFVREPRRSDETLQALGVRALFIINLVSFQQGTYTEPLEVDREKYGEGEGLALGRYMASLDGIARNKLKLSSDPEKSGVDDENRVWVTLEPSPVEKSIIVKPPLFMPSDNEADFRMRLQIPERFRKEKSESLTALKGLRKKLALDEERRLFEQRRAAEEAPDSQTGQGPKIQGRLLYAKRLLVHKVAIPDGPKPAVDTLPDAA